MLTLRLALRFYGEAKSGELSLILRCFSGRSATAIALF